MQGEGAFVVADHPAFSGSCRKGLKPNGELSARAPSFFRHLFGVDGILNPLRRLGHLAVRLLLGSVFDLAQRVLHFAFDLPGRALQLFLRIAGPLPRLAFNASRYILQLAFNPIFIHAVLLLFSFLGLAKWGLSRSAMALP